MRSYKTAIIGTDPACIGLLDYLAASERFELCSIFEKNKIKCKELSSSYNITGYDDSRHLILTEKPEIIILLLPNYLAGECIHTATGLGCNVFKKSPVARDFSESQNWINVSQKNNCALAISCQTRNNPLTDMIVNMINTNQTIGTLYHSSINNFCQFEGVLDWRGEPIMSGGGVLLEGNFDYIDLLTRINGLPQRVYSINTDICKKSSLPPYLTEDTALVTMEYNNRSIANLSCGWMAGTRKLAMAFYGTEGSIHSDGKTVIRYNRQNEIQEQHCYDQTEQKVLITQLELLTDHLDNPDFNLAGTATSYNNTIATINAAYLSATTRSPEEPSKLIEHM